MIAAVVLSLSKDKTNMLLTGLIAAEFWLLQYKCIKHDFVLLKYVAENLKAGIST